MGIEWITIETLAILVESLAIIYFLNSRHPSVYDSHTAEIIAAFVVISWSAFATFSNASPFIYDGIRCAIVVCYVFLTKRGAVPQKLFTFFIAEAVLLGSTLAGAGIASIFTREEIEDARLFPNSARLLTIILVKALQVILLYMFSKKRNTMGRLKRKPMLILSLAAVLDFSCLVFMFARLSDFSMQANGLLIWLSTGLLLILVGIFLMYELFIGEEEQNIDLSNRLQRLELESRYFRETNAVQSDLRTWRHEYKNNLIALRALIEDASYEKALEYLDRISIESGRENAMLQTGNPVLDAVVSSKLWLARSRGIDVSIQAVYPEDNRFEDNDLCAIAGNLLDNAIEACERMTEASQPRFISFVLLMKGKNLVLSISNSFSGELKQVNGRYQTVKSNQFHGVGIQYVDSIVDKYQGHVLREHEDCVFETHVVLPLIPAHKKNAAVEAG